MRKLLRASGWTARGLLWFVKGLLLLAAVATLVVWPMSGGKFFRAGGSNVTVRPQKVDEVYAGIACSDGRIIAWHGVVHFRGAQMPAMGRDLAVRGEGRSWFFHSGRSSDFGSSMRHELGPLCWEFKTKHDPDYAYELLDTSVPCWLVVPLLAA